MVLIVDNIKVGGAWIGNTALVRPKSFMGQKSKAIMGFYIASEHRGKGYGHQLINEIVKDEKEKGTEYLILGVEKENVPAIKIYERAGFVKDGEFHGSMYYMWKKL